MSAIPRSFTLLGAKPVSFVAGDTILSSVGNPLTLGTTTVGQNVTISTGGTLAATFSGANTTLAGTLTGPASGDFSINAGTGNRSIALTPSGAVDGTGGKVTSTHRLYVGSGAFTENGLVGNGYIQSRVQDENNQLRLVNQSTTGSGATGQNWLAFDYARGTYASPTAPQSGDIFGTIVSVGNFTGGGHGAQATIKASENWTSTAYGSTWDFFSVPNTTTTPTVNLTVGYAGQNVVRVPNQLMVGSLSVDAYSTAFIDTIDGSSGLVVGNSGNSTARLHAGVFSNGGYLANNFFYSGGQRTDNASLASSAIILGSDQIILFQTAPASATPSRVTQLTLNGATGLATLAGNLTVSGTTAATAYNAASVTLAGGLGVAGDTIHKLTVSFVEMTAPGATLANGSLYVDAADHKFKFRGNSGTVTTLANP